MPSLSMDILLGLILITLLVSYDWGGSTKWHWFLYFKYTEKESKTIFILRDAIPSDIDNLFVVPQYRL